MTKTRRRFKQTTSLQDRLAKFQKDIHARALQLPGGPKKRELLQKASNAEIAADIDQRRTTPELAIGRLLARAN